MYKYLVSLFSLCILVLLCYENVFIVHTAAYIQRTLVTNTYNPGPTGYSPRRISARAINNFFYVVTAFSDNQNNQPPYRIRVSCSTNTGSSWFLLPDPNITPVDCNKGFSIAVDSIGKLHLVWHAWETDESGHFYYRNYSDGTGWSSPEKLSDIAENGGRSPQIAVDSQDNIHVVWQNEGDGTNYYRKKTGSTWGSIVNIGVLGNQTSLAIDYNNDVHVVGGYGFWDLFYIKCTSGTWGSIETIEHASGNSPRHASIAVDSSNQPHVAWCGDAGYGTPWRIYYSTRSGSAWTVKETLSDPTITNHDPTLAIDTSNNFYVVYHAAPVQYWPEITQLCFRKKSYSGGWSAQEFLTDLSVRARSPHFRWSSWPTSNRVTADTDIDLVWAEENPPAPIPYPLMYNHGMALEPPTPTLTPTQPPSPTWTASSTATPSRTPTRTVTPTNTIITFTATPTIMPTPGPIPVMNHVGILIVLLLMNLLLFHKRHKE